MTDKLLSACRTNNKAKAKDLLDQGANVNIKDNDANKNRTCLHWAVLYNNLDLIKLLIDHGAAINAKDSDGQTPLYEAKRRKEKDYSASAITTLLKQHGVTE